MECGGFQFGISVELSRMHDLVFNDNRRFEWKSGERLQLF